MRSVIRHIAEASIAAEVMCFSGFPGETLAEAEATVNFLQDLQSFVSLFMFGEFSLTRGSAVAANPADYDIEQVWTVTGDELGSVLFYTPAREWKSEEELIRLDEMIRALSSAWNMRPYPWAGSLSTAHTLLWYDRYGPAAFRRSGAARAQRGDNRSMSRPDKGIERIRRVSGGREAAVWHTMIYDRKTVSRRLYEKLIAGIPPLRFRGGR